MSRPGILNITIYEGATWIKPFELTDSGSAPLDLTGYTAELRISSSRGGTADYVATSADDLSIDELGGVITATIPATATDALEFEKGVWELDMTDGSGVVTRLLMGSVTVQQRIEDPA
jgi:hypothetical protein